MMMCSLERFHYDVTAAMLVFQNKEMAAISLGFSLLFRSYFVLPNFWSLRNLIKQLFHSRSNAIQRELSVVAVRTSLRSVRTATTSGQYSPVRPEQSRIVSCLLYGTLFLIVKCTSGAINLFSFLSFSFLSF